MMMGTQQEPGPQLAALTERSRGYCILLSNPTWNIDYTLSSQPPTSWQKFAEGVTAFTEKQSPRQFPGSDVV
jgi:hypothetical protein